MSYWFERSKPRSNLPVVGHFLSETCVGEVCGMCWRESGDPSQLPTPATHKIGEEIPYDDPNQMRHNLTQYVCCAHFAAIMGRSGYWCAR